jgi:polygalacturonase
MARSWPWPWLLAALLFCAAGAGAQETCARAPPRRGARVSVADFGGAGDGRTLNTAAFARAVASIDRRRAPGGATLYVPPGVWLTGPFNLTSRMTLFLARGAVIRATQVISEISRVYFREFLRKRKKISCFNKKKIRPSYWSLDNWI